MYLILLFAVGMNNSVHASCSWLHAISKINFSDYNYLLNEQSMYEIAAGIIVLVYKSVKEIPALKPGWSFISLLHSLGTDCIVWEYEDLREQSMGCFKLRLLCYCSNILNLCKFHPINLLIRKLSRILMQVAPLWMREFGPLYLNVLSTGRPLNVLDIYVTNKRVIWSSLQIDILTVKDSDKDLEAHT